MMINPEAQQYFATSSIAIAAPMTPAPLPPYCSGIVSPSSPSSRNASKMSCGYSSVSPISAALGATTSRATRRTVSRISRCSSLSSKSIFLPPRAYQRMLT